MSLRAIAVAVGVALGVAGLGPVEAAPVEVRVARGLDGVVPVGGVDLAVVEVRSGADVALAGSVEVGGRSYTVELAARGVAVVTLAARLPPGASAVTALPVRARIGGGEVAAVVPGARVVARPIVVVSDAPAATLAAVEAWRASEQLGEPVVIAPARVPTWAALQRVGALVIDRPAAELPAAAAQTVRRFLAAGGRVCRFVDGATPRCAQADPLAAPQTRARARIAPALGAWAWAALALALGLGVVAWLPRRRGAAALAVLVVGAAAPVIGAVRGADSRLAVHGVRATAGGGEDWIAAELGVSELAGALGLGDALWIEPTGGDGGGPLDDIGLRGRVPGPGAWRLRGFVPAAARGWTDGLARRERALPELP